MMIWVVSGPLLSPRATFMPISDLVCFEEEEDEDAAGRGERQNVFSRYIRVSVACGCMSSSTPPLSSTYTSRSCTTPMNRRVGRPRILSRASASGFWRRLKVWCFEGVSSSLAAKVSPSRSK